MATVGTANRAKRGTPRKRTDVMRLRLDAVAIVGADPSTATLEHLEDLQ